MAEVDLSRFRALSSPRLRGKAGDVGASGSLRPDVDTLLVCQVYSEFWGGGRWWRKGAKDQVTEERRSTEHFHVQLQASAE